MALTSSGLNGKARKRRGSRKACVCASAMSPNQTRPASAIDIQAAKMARDGIGKRSRRRAISSPLFRASSESEALNEAPISAANRPIAALAHCLPWTSRRHHRRARKPTRVRACSGQTALTAGTRARGSPRVPRRRGARTRRSRMPPLARPGPLRRGSPARPGGPCGSRRRCRRAAPRPPAREK